MLKPYFYFLLPLLLISCTAAAPPKTDSPPVAESPSPLPTPAPAKEFLISREGLGPARVGQKLGELKQQLAGKAEFGEDEPFMVDINAIPVRQNQVVQFYILHLSSEPLTDADPIPLLMTDNPQYRTAEGIGPGSAIAAAEKVYGKATLSYNPDNESREYVRFSNFPDENISFRTNGSPGEFAGIYPDTPKESFYETQQYRQDSAAIRSVLVDRSR